MISKEYRAYLDLHREIRRTMLWLRSWGVTPKATCEWLGISPKTYEQRWHRIKRKFGVNDTCHLIRLAVSTPMKDWPV